VPVYLLSYFKLLGWTLIPPALGLLLQRIDPPKKLSHNLFLFSLFGIQMPVILMAIWVAEISSGTTYTPLFTLTGWLVTIGVSRWISGRMNQPPRQRGAFIVSMGLSNNGYTLLGLIAMVMFGDEGIAQATYAQLFVTPFLVFVCFPIGRFYGENEGRMDIGSLFRKTVMDTRSLPILTMLTGLILNLAGVERPTWCGPLVRAMVYIGTIATGIAVGLLLDGSSQKRFVRENLYSFVYRSTFYPLMFFAMAKFAGLDMLNTSILLLFGLVPSALYSNLVADFFGLDTDLTSSVFAIGTTMFVVFVLPLYVLAVRYI